MYVVLAMCQQMNNPLDTSWEGRERGAGAGARVGVGVGVIAKPHPMKAKRFVAGYIKNFATLCGHSKGWLQGEQGEQSSGGSYLR